MLRLVVPLLVLSVSVVSLTGQEEPPQDVFNHSSRDLVFQIPADFKLLGQERTYLIPETHEVPCLRRVWEHGGDSIIITVFVLPDIAWQRQPKQMFADGLIGMLGDPELKTAPRRNYELDGASAVSIVCSYKTPGENSQRMDWILLQPNIFMVAYLSPRPLSWDDAACKAFFQTLSLKSKK